jgi:hypothetical protein
MAAPTFVQEAETVFNTSTTPKTTATITSTAVGDVLVSLACAENGNATALAPTLSGETWVAQEEGGVSGVSCEIDARTCIIASSGSSETVSVAATGAGSDWWGANVLQFTGSDGVGAAESAFAGSGAPSLAITTTQDNSAIAVVVADFNAVDGASRTWRAVNGTTPTAANGFERTYFRDASHYTLYIAYYPDAGTAGAKTVGLTAPTGQTYSIAAIEVKGTAAGGAPTPKKLAILGVG